MTLYAYNFLDEAEQHEALWQNGVHIGDRIEGEFKVVLYQIYAFYVELYYHLDHNVLKLRSFSSTLLLDPYLAGVDTSVLL